MGALVGAEFPTLVKGFIYVRKIVAFLFTAKPFVFVFFSGLFLKKKKVFKLRTKELVLLNCGVGEDS